MRNSISQLNNHVISIVNWIIDKFEAELDIREVINNGVEYIEKNMILLKYEDNRLYKHQKDVFTIMKTSGPKLVLYIAPTGTGKTLTPIGLSEEHKIIFVCAARHVGLALAKAAISINKKIAFAFGCASADDIRLHYFAAKDFIKNKRSGGIGKVDNSVGDKVEIMICDVKSYLPAMYYMLAFNPKEKIIVYWDEPTITLDYPEHELHEIIQKNWSENLIPNMILSSATLPKLHELTSTIGDFREKFDGARIHNIVSNDCKKSIPLINKYGYVVLPHYLSEDFEKILEIVQHCESNLTLLRYFDLKEIIEFIMYVEKNDFIPSNTKICRKFLSLEDVTMERIKLHYLELLKKVIGGTWGMVYSTLKRNRVKRIMPNDKVDLTGKAVFKSISKSISIGPGTSGNNVESKGETIGKGETIERTFSMQDIVQQPMKNNETEEGNCAIYVTTKDSYTLTDGPTIFLANNVEKVAKFCIQQAAIPASVMDEIMKRIEFNNILNAKIGKLQNELEDIIEKGATKDDSHGSSSKKKGGEKSDEKNEEKKHNIWWDSNPRPFNHEWVAQPLH